MDGLEVVGNVLRVGGQVLQRVRDGPHVVAGRLQRGDFTAPAGRVRPRAVHQDDRRLGLPGRQAPVQPMHQCGLCHPGLRSARGRPSLAGAVRDQCRRNRGDGGQRQKNTVASWAAADPLHSTGAASAENLSWCHDISLIFMIGRLRPCHRHAGRAGLASASAQANRPGSAAGQATGGRLVRAAGVESEMEPAFAGVASATGAGAGPGGPR